MNPKRYKPLYLNLSGVEINSDFEKFGIGFRTIHGLYLNDYFSMAVGLGVDKIAEQTVFPIFGDLRIYFSRLKETIYFFGNYGYSFSEGVEPFFQKNAGSMLFSGFGFRTNRGGKYYASIDLGYRFQYFRRITFRYNNGTGMFSSDIFNDRFDAFVIRFAVSF
ncbi:MAG: hypothetical protein ABIE07_00740 [Candidatus Zixiibacteriota bacterium]